MIIEHNSQDNSEHHTNILQLVKWQAA